MPPNTLNRSSISLLLSGLSMLARVSQMAGDNLAIFSDELRKAFVIREITTFTRTFQSLNFALKGAGNSLRRIKITLDPTKGPKMYEILRSGELKEINTLLGRNVKEIIEAYSKGKKTITSGGRSYSITQKQIGTESQEIEGESIHIPTIEEIFAEVLDTIKQGPLVTSIKSLFGGGNTKEGTNFLQQQGSFFKEYAGADKFGKLLFGIGTYIPKALGAPFRYLQSTGEKLKTWGGNAWNNIGKLLGVPAQKWTALGKGLGPLVGAGMMAGAIGVLISIVMALLDALNPFKPLMEALSAIFGIYGEILSTAFMPLIEKLYELMLSDTTITLLTSLANVVMNVVNAFLPLLNVLLPIGNIILGTMLLPLNLFASVLMTLAVPLGMVANLIAFLVQGIADFVAFFWSSFQPAFNTFNSLLSAIANWDWESVKKNFVNLFIDIINGFINIINGALGWAGVNIKQIPRLATGGIVTKPTIAMIGEAGPEAVIPLNKQNTPKTEGLVINIYGDVTEEKLYQLKHDMLIRGIY